jgi:hypothetical protein
MTKSGRAFEVLKIKEFTFVNNCFQNESNEVFGVFLRRLFNEAKIPLENSGISLPAAGRFNLHF